MTQVTPGANGAHPSIIDLGLFTGSPQHLNRENETLAVLRTVAQEANPS